MLLIALRQLSFVSQRVRNVQQRARGVQYDLTANRTQLFQNFQGFLIGIPPDIFSVYYTGKQNFFLGESIFLYQCHRLFSLCEVQTDAVKVQCCDLRIAVPHIAEVCLQQHLDIALCRQDSLVNLGKQSNILCGQIFYQIRFVQFSPCSTQFIQLFQIIAVCLDCIFYKVRECLFTGESCQLQECKRSDQHQLCRNAQCLCFCIFCKRLFAGKANFCGVLNFRHHIVVVGVEPLFHCECFYVTVFALIATCHCKIGVQRRQRKSTIAFRNRIQQNGGVQHVVIERKVVDRNQRDSIFLL